MPLPAALQDRAGMAEVVDNMNVRHTNAQMAGRASTELHTLVFFRGKETLADARVVKVQANGLQVRARCWLNYCGRMCCASVCFSCARSGWFAAVMYLCPAQSDLKPQGWSTPELVADAALQNDQGLCVLQVFVPKFGIEGPVFFGEKGSDTAGVHLNEAKQVCFAASGAA